MPLGVPPTTSTFSMLVKPFKPLKPSRLVDTFTLIGFSVIWPMLVLAMAIAFPSSRKSADSRFVRFASARDQYMWMKYYSRDLGPGTY